ncbi:GNAT family N-acetyltransferase [Guptibacillus sedimenti]|uniref:GNAT family N-acetyltransferase n=1 Tax=Guptibacillus sedimenti TaxID=3025680 RepID=UPI00236087AC|nr:GNAT family protein [Pseudalkalibacillus sedimenti]
MTYKFEVMTQDQAEDISYNWHYEGEYSFYDMEADEEDLQEFVDPELRGDTKFAVMKNSELIGFFSVNKVDNLTYDIGLGMRPDLTNRGMGLDFLKAGLAFVKNVYNPRKITLSVATFNQRAIKVYRKLGFRDVNTFMQDTNASTFEFLKMEYER